MPPDPPPARRRPADRDRYLHILDAARRAVSLARGKSRADLDRDDVLSLALTRLVEIIGEAASRVSDEGAKVCPAIPWAEMRGMRNRLIHAYFDVDLNILWDTITLSLPQIVAEIESAQSQNRL